jgi:hypothetical protein
VPAFGLTDRSGSHHCWIFDEPAQFHSRARAFLSEGMRRNERVWYVGEGSEEDLLGQVGGIGFDAAMDRGAARVVPVAQAYSGGVRPQAQVDSFARHVEAALADGYRGLRVAADGTSLAALPSWNQYEHLVDRFIVERPLSGLCGFDRRRLDRPTTAALECLHPITNTDAVSFRLTACSPAADRFALSGELDFANHDLLVRALSAANPRPADGTVVVDMRGLRFADHQTILLLRDYARDRGATLTLLDPRPLTGHIAELIGDRTIRIASTR